MSQRCHQNTEMSQRWIKYQLLISHNSSADDLGNYMAITFRHSVELNGANFTGYLLTWRRQLKNLQNLIRHKFTEPIHRKNFTGHHSNICWTPHDNPFTGRQSTFIRSHVVFGEPHMITFTEGHSTQGKFHRASQCAWVSFTEPQRINLHRTSTRIVFTNFAETVEISQNNHWVST